MKINKIAEKVEKTRPIINTDTRIVDVLPIEVHSTEASEDSNLLKAEDLTSAFIEFSILSEQLTKAYRTLETQVTHLTDELNQVSDQRIEALEEKEKIANRLENILDFLPGGVIVIDSKGKVTDNNPVAAVMLNVPLKGFFWRDLIDQCFAPQSDDGHEVSTLSGRRISIAIKSLEDQGQIILLTDQTETRDLQAQLSRHERLTSMGKMVSALAHQIRTPLSAAMLYAGHLKNESLSFDKRQRFVDKLSSRLHHMEQQVRDMLLFVKGDLTLNDNVSVDTFIHKLQEAAESLLSQNNAECEWDIENVDAVFKCNVDVLISALMNVIENAVQAVLYKPQICIRTVIEEDHLVISISDNGPGVDQSIIEKIGEAFLTSKPQGLGLGISVVRTVAAGHGGHFEIRNLRAGGAIASIRIPLLEYSIAEHSSEKYSVVAQVDKNVLRQLTQQHQLSQQYNMSDKGFNHQKINNSRPLRH
ncbi:MAG: GHKL domain-containing protein [Cellvibrionaceae bacterium]